jgi:hypothetical protein
MSTLSKQRAARSPAHLSHISQKSFEERLATLKKNCADSEDIRHAFGDFAQSSAKLAEATKKARERALGRQKITTTTGHELVKRKVQPQSFGPDSTIRTAPYDWP